MGIRHANKPVDHNGSQFDRPMWFTYAGDKAYSSGYMRTFGKEVEYRCYGCSATTCYEMQDGRTCCAECGISMWPEDDDE